MRKEKHELPELVWGRDIVDGSEGIIVGGLTKLHEFADEPASLFLGTEFTRNPGWFVLLLHLEAVRAM